MSFDLKDYITVRERMADFYKRYPDGSLQMDAPEIITVEGKTWAIGRAYAYRSPDDSKPGIGTAWEIVPGLTPYTRGSELQNLETSCWGRALAAIGIGIDRGVATAEEVRRSMSYGKETAYNLDSLDSASSVSRLDKVPDDDPFYQKSHKPADYTGNVRKRRISEKQRGLLKGKLEGVGITGAATIPTINAILDMFSEGPVALPADLDNHQLDLILQNLDKVQNVSEFLQNPSDTG